MAITLLRCDDRLIHGQCIVGVLKDYKMTNIILVDDFTASNAILSKIYKTAVPNTVSLKTCTSAEAISEIEKAAEDDSKTLVLVKDPIIVLDLIKKGAKLPDKLNVGPMSCRPDSKKTTFFSYLLPQEFEAINELANIGEEVYFQQVPSDKKILWSSIAESCPFC